LVQETEEMNAKLVRVGSWLLRIALAMAFLSAVADRFGLWGPPGSPGVGWGDLRGFNAYVAKLNWFVPAGLIPVVGWASTAAETGLALALLIGWKLRWVSLASALLLLSFAATMTVALGPKAPLDYSVFTAAAAAFLLFATQPSRTNET
jgi:putative oxidoreductase